LNSEGKKSKLSFSKGYAPLKLGTAGRMPLSLGGRKVKAF
jgi:hypothetical protein